MCVIMYVVMRYSQKRLRKICTAYVLAKRNVKPHQGSDRADLLPHQNVITYFDTIGQLAKAIFLQQKKGQKTAKYASELFWIRSLTESILLFPCYAIKQCSTMINQ